MTACYCVFQLAFMFEYPAEQDTGNWIIADLHYISLCLIRYQPVAPCRWTDSLLSKLWELPSLTGKLPVSLTSDKLRKKHWANIAGRLLSDK